MKKVTGVLLGIFFSILANGAFGDDGKATPQDVYKLVKDAHDVLSSLGEEGLAAFNNPKGEFVRKDTYVFVMKCPDTMVAHPFAMEKLKGKDLRKMTPGMAEALCKGAKNPDGSWIEYTWPKKGEKKRSRKISFIISVEGTPYQVAAGIYNDTETLEELNKTLK
jgi:cytochrome c